MMQRLVQLALDLFDPPGPQERAAGASPTAAGLPAEKIKPERPVALIDKAQKRKLLKQEQAPRLPPLHRRPPWRRCCPPLNSAIPRPTARCCWAMPWWPMRCSACAGAALASRLGPMVWPCGRPRGSRSRPWMRRCARNRAWILRKLNESRERQQRIEGGRIAWGHGAQLPYLGEALTVVLDPTHGFSGKGGALHSAVKTLVGRACASACPTAPARRRSAMPCRPG
jgi:hypothetical protein